MLIQDVMYMRLLIKNHLFLFIFCILSMSLSAQVYTVTGTVVDSTSNKTIPDVLAFSGSIGTKTQQNGNFVLSLPKGKNIIQLELMGFFNRKIEIDVQKNIDLGNIILTNKDIQLGF